MKNVGGLMIDPLFQVVGTGMPVVIASFDISSKISQHVNVASIFRLKLFL
jgi:hypothetical protein